MKAIRKEADESPELVKSAPLCTPVKRVDAVRAARKPVLKQS
jgi:glycine dehydrogenase subunit 2